MECKLYKILNKEGRSYKGGEAKWSLPKKLKDGTWRPGKWMHAIRGRLIPCENGYHLCYEKDLISWLGESIYEAEYLGEIIEDGNKVVVRRARLTRKYDSWNERTARLFICWCVRNTPLTDGRTVWNLLKDERSKKAVKIGERYAIGKATKKELATARTAAKVAAHIAARAAEDSAKWNATWGAAVAAVQATAKTAVAAAGTAAREAAWSAAEAAKMEVKWRKKKRQLPHGLLREICKQKNFYVFSKGVVR